jgi:hypothetical protein
MLPLLVLLLALPDPAAAQRRNREGGGSDVSQGQAIPRSEAPAPSSAAPAASAPAPSPAADPAPATASSRVAPRTQTRDEEAGSAPSGARPREGRQTAGIAVPRGSVPPPLNDRPIVVAPRYYGSYWPWGFGGFGYGSYYGYYGGLYYPYYPSYYGVYGPYGYGAYGYPSTSYTYGFEGAVRLKVKPRDAQVFVDGYYVGVVDEFDGVFQRLHIEAGPHRIEVRAPGYETLTFNVRVRYDDTTSLEGELQRLP